MVVKTIRWSLILAASLSSTCLTAQAQDVSAKDAFIKYHQVLSQAADYTQVPGISQEDKNRLSKLSKQKQMEWLKDEKTYGLRNLEKVKDEVEGHVATVSGVGMGRKDNGKDYYANMKAVMVKEGDNWEIFSKSITNEFSPFNGSEIEPGDSVDEKIRKKISKNWKLVSGNNWVCVFVTIQPNGTLTNMRMNSIPKNPAAEQAVRTAFAKAGPLLSPGHKMKLPQVMRLAFSSVYDDETNTLSIGGPLYYKPGEEDLHLLTRRMGITITKTAPGKVSGNPKSIPIDKVVENMEIAVDNKDFKSGVPYAEEAIVYFGKRPSGMSMDFKDPQQQKAALMSSRSERLTDKIKDGLLKSKNFDDVERLAKAEFGVVESKKDRTEIDYMAALTGLAEVYVLAGKDAEADATVKQILDHVPEIKAKIPPTPPESDQSVSISFDTKDSPAEQKKKVDQLTAMFKAAQNPMALMVPQSRLYLAYKKKSQDERAKQFEEMYKKALGPAPGSTNETPPDAVDTKK